MPKSRGRPKTGVTVGRVKQLVNEPLPRARKVQKSGTRTQARRKKETPATRTRSPSQKVKRKKLDPVRPVFLNENPDMDPEDGRHRPVPDTFRDVPERHIETAKLAAIEAMRRHGVIVEACRASGIGRDRLYRMMKGDSDFRQRMQHARQDRFDELERAMIERGTWPKGDLAGIFTLKHNRKRYREVQRVELTGKDGAPVAYVDAKAELLRRLEQITARQAPAQLAGSGGSRGPELVTDEGIEIRKIARGFSGKSRR